MSSAPTYGIKRKIGVPLPEAESRVRAALAEEGFGVLTEIDMKATLKAKLAVDFRPYKILGACNPQLAHQALEEELEIGLLLPCNIIIYEDEEPGTTVVSILNPVLQIGIAGRADMVGLAEEVKSKMERVLVAL